MSPAGEPFGAFARVLAETREAGLAIEPFDITEDFVLQPPSEARMKKLEQSSAAYLLAQAVAVGLIRTQGDPPEDTDARIAWAETQQKALKQAYETAEAAETAYNEALYGDADVLQRVEEFFADRPGWQKQAFANAVNQQFRRLPKDGACSVCGQAVDAEAGESGGESSGGSSISGESSKVTSPSTVTELMHVTGLEEPAPGPSSSPTPTTSPD